MSWGDGTIRAHQAMSRSALAILGFLAVWALTCNPPWAPRSDGPAGEHGSELTSGYPLSEFPGGSGDFGDPVVTPSMVPQPSQRQPSSEAACTASDSSPRTLRYIVTDEFERPLAGVHVEVDTLRSPHGSVVDGRTDPSGICVLEFDLPRHELDGGCIVAVARASASGRGSALELLAGDLFANPARTAERRLVLPLTGSLRVSVRDESGEPVPHALLRFHLVRRTEFLDGMPPPAPWARSDLQHQSDSTGQLTLRDLYPGRWSVVAVPWRNSGGCESELVDVFAGGASELELEVELWDPQDYASGTVVLPPDGERCAGGSKEYFLRLMDSLTRRIRVHDDGAFYLIASEESELWEVVRDDGIVCSPPLELRAGLHGLRVSIEPRQR